MNALYIIEIHGLTVQAEHISTETSHQHASNVRSFEKSAGALGAYRPRWDPFVNARARRLIIWRRESQFENKGGAPRPAQSDCQCPMARHALGVAPPRAVRARLVMRLGGHSAHHREEARLVAAARAYRVGAVLGRGRVRAQLLDERVAPGGGVGVEVLEGEHVGPKARADAQVGARDHRVGRAVLARLTRRVRPPTGSTRHAHMARRRSWTRAFSAQSGAVVVIMLVVIVAVVIVSVVWLG